MPPVPEVLSCLGTSPGLNAFGLADTLPVGPIFPETGDAVFVMKRGKKGFKQLQLHGDLKIEIQSNFNLIQNHNIQTYNKRKTYKISLLCS